MEDAECGQLVGTTSSEHYWNGKRYNDLATYYYGREYRCFEKPITIQENYYRCDLHSIKSCECDHITATLIHIYGRMNEGRAESSLVARIDRRREKIEIHPSSDEYETVDFSDLDGLSCLQEGDKTYCLFYIAKCGLLQIDLEDCSIPFFKAFIKIWLEWQSERYKLISKCLLKGDKWYVRESLVCEECKAKFEGIKGNRFCSVVCEDSEAHKRGFCPIGKKTGECFCVLAYNRSFMFPMSVYKSKNEGEKQYSFGIEYGTSAAKQWKKAQEIEQDGKCSLCLEGGKRLVLDHDHKTNLVRGLICGSCNNTLSYKWEDIGFQVRAIDYLSGGIKPLQLILLKHFYLNRPSVSKLSFNDWAEKHDYDLKDASLCKNYCCIDGPWEHYGEVERASQRLKNGIVEHSLEDVKWCSATGCQTLFWADDTQEEFCSYNCKRLTNSVWTVWHQATYKIKEIMETKMQSGKSIVWRFNTNDVLKKTKKRRIKKAQ